MCVQEMISSMRDNLNEVSWKYCVSQVIHSEATKKCKQKMLEKNQENQCERRSRQQSERI